MIKLIITPKKILIYNTETQSIYNSWSYEAMQKYLENYKDGNIERIFNKIWQNIREYERNDYKIGVETSEE